MWLNHLSINKAGRITRHQSRKTNENKILSTKFCKKTLFPQFQEETESSASLAAAGSGHLLLPSVPADALKGILQSWAFSDGYWQYLLGVRKPEICYFFNRSTSHSVFWKWKELDWKITVKKRGSSCGQEQSESQWSQNRRNKGPLSFSQVIAILFSLKSKKLLPNQSWFPPVASYDVFWWEFPKCSKELSFEKFQLPWHLQHVAFFLPKKWPLTKITGKEK